MTSTRRTPLFTFLSLAVLACLVELWVVTSSGFSPNVDVLAFAVTVDLVFGIPLLYYILLVRSRHSRAVTVVPVFIAALILAHLILPSSGQMYLERLQYLAIAAEGFVMVYAMLKLRTVVRRFREVRPRSVYASDALEVSLRHTFGTNLLTKVIATELSLLYYVTGGWFQRFKTTNATDVSISCYRKSGYGLMMAMFLWVIILETIGLHVLVQHWSPVAAWVLTAISVYSLIWAVGYYQSVRLHPIVLGTAMLHLRTGVLWRADIAWTNIAAVQRAQLGKKYGADYLNIAVFGEPRFVLDLKEPVTVYGLFGKEKQVSRVGITVDDDALFQTEVTRRVDGTAYSSVR